MKFKYSVSPFNGYSSTSSGSIDKSSQQMEDVLNVAASRGWEFHELSNINIRVSPGCLAGLFGAAEHTFTQDMLVFRRLVDDSESNVSTHEVTIGSAAPTLAEIIDDGPKGTCPNCDAIISMSANPCPKCKAQFGVRGGWSVKAIR